MTVVMILQDFIYHVVENHDALHVESAYGTVKLPVILIEMTANTDIDVRPYINNS